MISLRQWSVITMIALLIVPQSALAARASAAHEVHLALTTGDLAHAHGGVMGGRIGDKNGGVLELRCGDTDDFGNFVFLGLQPPYQTIGSQTNFYGPCSATAPNLPIPMAVLPHYTIGFGPQPQFAINATITRNVFDPPNADPHVEVFLNGAFFASVPCQRSYPWRGGIAVNVSNVQAPVESWSCPTADGSGFYVRDLTGVSLKHGSELNVLAARTFSGNGDAFQEESFQDQEVRFFRVN